MSGASNSVLSATIADMIDIMNLPKSKRKSELRTPLNILSPLKRRLSSESVESPEKRCKTDNSLDVSWIASPREAKRMRADLIGARSHIINLENRIKHMHEVRKELQVMYDNEIKSYQAQKEHNRKIIDELEKQLQSIRKREQETKNDLDMVKNQLSVEKVEHQNKIDQLEIQISKLQSECKITESAETQEVSKMKSHIENLERTIENAKQEDEINKELIKQLKDKLTKLTAIERKIVMRDEALQAAELKIKDLEYKIENFNDWEQQAKISQKRLLAYPDMEKELHKLREENKRIKDEVQNKLILEEQVYDLNTRLENFRNQEKKLANLQASHIHLEHLVDEWRLLVNGLCDTNVPDALLSKQMRQYVEKLQQQELSLTTEKVQLESQLKASLHDLKLAKFELERNMKQISDLQATRQQHQTLIHRFQKKLTLVTRERDSYRMQLDAYEKDLTMNVTSSQGAGQVATQKEQLKHMEKIADDYKNIATKLEGDLEKCKSLSNAESTVPVRLEQLTRMQDEIDKLQNENARLTERCDELVIRLEQELIGKDQVKGQVVHLKLNPLAEILAERESSVEKLQAEVDRLKRKIVNLEEGIDSSKLGESICSSRELQNLREQLKSSEIKLQRLKECFKAWKNEFRDVCYTLLGYRIDRVANNQYRLSSMYAEASNDCLEFQLNDDSSLNLLETPYSATLEDMIDLHLRHQSSIPVFLSAVTMDLFNRTTMATKTYAE